MFEGKYFFGKKNGKGKEYYKNGNIKFEGNFLNNRKIDGKIYNSEGNEVFEIIKGKGNVKEFNDNGILEYEGKYLDGERNGEGKEYNNKGEIIFEGEYINGKRWNGKGYNDEGKIELQLENGKGI